MAAMQKYCVYEGAATDYERREKICHLVDGLQIWKLKTGILAVTILFLKRQRHRAFLAENIHIQRYIT